MAVARIPGRSLDSFSPTALATWRLCRAKWKYRYNDKRPTDGPPTASKVLGDAAHHALAAWAELAPAQRSEATLAGLFRHAWSLLPRDGAFADSDEEAAWGRKGLDALSWYCAAYGAQFRPLLIEEWVRATMAANGRVVAGRVDRVDLAADGTALEIVDYKTGRCRISQDGLRFDTPAQVYVLAAARTLRRPVAAVTFVYLTERVERRWVPTGAEMAEVEERLVELTDEIACADRFEPHPGPHCRLCDFRAICPAAEPTPTAATEPVEVVF